MRPKSRYSLQRTMIIYFLLIVFATLLVGVEFLVDFQPDLLKSEIWQSIPQTQQGAVDPEVLFAPIDRLRSKAMLMVVIIMVVMVIVLTMFVKHITEPLQHMIQLSQKISAGDLSQTITIQSDNELSELGNVINEMASNLQEIILLSKRMCINGQQFVEIALEQIHEEESGKQSIHNLERTMNDLGNELSMLNDVISYFSFYTVDRKPNV
jgi:methyl-accepting chemotaxis protein